VFATTKRTKCSGLHPGRHCSHRENKIVTDFFRLIAYSKIFQEFLC
jgi:hypothetical protein